MSLALIVIDMQKEYYQPPAEDLMKRAAEYIHWTHALFQKHGAPTVIVQDADMPEGVKAPGFANIDAIAALKGVKAQVSKIHANAFFDTPLESMLKDWGVQFVVLAGFDAIHCITATWFGAKERGFTTALLKGGIASSDPKYVAHTEEVRDTVSYATLEWMLGKI